jgi:hypothetical protein
MFKQLLRRLWSTHRARVICLLLAALVTAYIAVLTMLPAPAGLLPVPPKELVLTVAGVLGGVIGYFATPIDAGKAAKSTRWARANRLFCWAVLGFVAYGICVVLLDADLADRNDVTAAMRRWLEKQQTLDSFLALDWFVIGFCLLSAIATLTPDLSPRRQHYELSESSREAESD